MVTGVCLSFSIQRKPRPLQYNQGESPCTLTISYQQYGSPHGQTHSARHGPEGALLPPGRDKACAGRPRQGCPSSQWVESSRDPWNVSVKVRKYFLQSQYQRKFLLQSFLYGSGQPTIVFLPGLDAYFDFSSKKPSKICSYK